MKKLMLIILTVLFFAACSYQDCHIMNVANSDNVTVEEALLYYNTNCAYKYTRANIDERLPFILGDAEWLWDKAQASSYENRSAIDIPLNGGYQYIVYRKQADGTYYSVRTLSRVIAVQDDASGNISFYIRISIPNKDDINTSTESLNFGDRANFSGLEYYITINGCPAAMVKFENGEQTDGIFLGDEFIDKTAKIRKFAKLFSGLCISRVSEASRTDVNIGKATGSFYDAVSGCWYSYIDIDGDGKVDGITGDFDPVVITPNQSLTANSGNGNGSGGGDGSSGVIGSNTGFDSVGDAGSNSSGVDGLNSGNFGGTGAGNSSGTGSTTTNNGNNQSKDKEDSFYDFSVNINLDGSISVNPIKNITLNPILDIIDLPIEPLTPNEIRSILLERLSSTNPILDFINSSNILIYPSSETNRTVTTLIADSKSHAIYYNNYYYNHLLNNTGRLLAIFHEFVHFYLNSADHQLMIDNPAYQQGLRDLFPDMSPIFYEYIQYIGCKGLFINTPDIHDDIIDFSYKYIRKQ